MHHGQRKIVKNADTKVMGVSQTSLAVIFDQQVLCKASAILACTSHPLHLEFESLLSGRRLECPGLSAIGVETPLCPVQ